VGTAAGIICDNRLPTQALSQSGDLGVQPTQHRMLPLPMEVVIGWWLPMVGSSLSVRRFMGPLVR